jgi:hypothetical protein
LFCPQLFFLPLLIHSLLLSLPDPSSPSPTCHHSTPCSYTFTTH